ncbi:predicted protein [Chaetomium globosum CBS 148.51]|uniref:Uncharacterized protein n=1 Tax=Chaetomium globosum (strain ATCC 6205 / CBS 148.51 / DSM 1962 / NBRC 6347 / NRRL 1970) TaxID=306901 RepID=Q2GWE3_CHAGB|nr:uncharacterized protein CHGG_07711 [Chaetomium globosum CBS 148.51]EAQ86458.1 predicted protein [Chaetomium globosum CBS 148.51]
MKLKRATTSNTTTTRPPQRQQQQQQQQFCQDGGCSPFHGLSSVHDQASQRVFGITQHPELLQTMKISGWAAFRAPDPGARGGTSMATVW